MNIAVYGCCGYVGSHLVPALVRSGHKVIGFDRHLYRQPCLGYCTQRESDLLDADVVVNLAAIAHDPQGDIPWRCHAEHNVDLPRRLMATSRRVVLVSSMSVFDSSEGNYIRSKRQMEEDFIRLGRNNTRVVRFGTIFGTNPPDSSAAHFRPHLLLNSMALDAVTRGCIAVHNASARRPVTPMSDAIATLQWTVEMALDQRAPGTITNCYVGSATIEEYARIVADMTGAARVTLDAVDRRNYSFAPELEEYEIESDVRGLIDFCRTHRASLWDLRGHQFDNLYKSLGLGGRND